MIDIDALPGRTRTWLKQSNIPQRHRGARFSDMDLTCYNPAVVVGAQTWRMRTSAGGVVGVNGEGLLLQGPPGHGKTMLACILANEVMLRTPRSTFQPRESDPIPMRPVYYVTYPGLLRLKQRMMDLDDSSEEWLRLARVSEGVFAEHAESEWNVRLLVLDDIGKEHTTRSGWAEDTFDDLLRARFDKALPTIITTNTPLEDTDDGGVDWEAAYGPAMASFAHQAFSVVSVINRLGDRRRS